jgi:uncharacterized membrane protein YecN with MAPEG domain
MLQITAFYAALLALLFVFLSVRVITERRERRVEFGAGDSGELMRAMRVHANFAEYAPFTLLLMALAESLAAPNILVHASGLALLVGRVMHAYGTSQSPPVMRYRIYGMGLTLAAITIGALTCLALSSLFLIV